MNNKYIEWNKNVLLSHEEDREIEQSMQIDLQDGRAAAHLRALIVRGGSTTEDIVTAFTVGDLDKLVSNNYTLQQQWERLDSYQQNLVLKLRYLTDGSSSLPLENQPFVPYFLGWVAEKRHSKLLQQEQEELGWEEKFKLAMQAQSEVIERLSLPPQDLFTVKEFD